MVALAELQIKDRLREVNADHVAVIASTIEAVGLQHPIIVTREGVGFRLVAGAHRVEAFKLLGHDHIPAQVVAVQAGDLDAFLEMEIVENVARHDLTALDRAIHLGNLEDIAKRRGLKGGRGGDRKSLNVRDNDQVKSFHFDDDQAARMQVSRRTIQSYLAIYRGLTAASQQRLKGSAFADNFVELRTLASLPEADQPAIVELLCAETPQVFSVKAAMARHFSNVDITKPDEISFARFVKLWTAASIQARKQIALYVKAQKV